MFYRSGRRDGRGRGSVVWRAAVASHIAGEGGTGDVGPAANLEWGGDAAAEREWRGEDGGPAAGSRWGCKEKQARPAAGPRLAHARAGGEGRNSARDGERKRACRAGWWGGEKSRMIGRGVHLAAAAAAEDALGGGGRQKALWDGTHRTVESI